MTDLLIAPRLGSVYKPGLREFYPFFARELIQPIFTGFRPIRLGKGGLGFYHTRHLSEASKPLKPKITVPDFKATEKAGCTIKLYHFPPIESLRLANSQIQLHEVLRALSDIQASTRREQEAVKHIVATIFSAQNALRDLAPGQRWAGMGNLLGDYGEFVALSNYNLRKGPAGADGYDAVTNDGSKVQIKANHSSSSIGFRGEADLLLVLKIESSAEWKELYYGPFKPVKDKASYSKRDNKYTIPVAKLQQIAKPKS